MTIDFFNQNWNRFLPLLGVDSCWLKLANFDSVVGDEDRELREFKAFSPWCMLLPFPPELGLDELVSWTVKDGKGCVETPAVMRKWKGL